MRECEALQEVIGRLIGRKQAQKSKNTNRSKMYLESANEVRRTNNGAFNAMTDEEDH
ncbi:hypothetical protein T05_7428 [Trichinella murrelli]|uniref:Uncharacterized protein n=1 Tax=Trichinella murrelli TaxID=144512 RepID=A0A0V0T779_9BILA|nr:hypothetical protein T05_7428 [Trichinella murrelli]